MTDESGDTSRFEMTVCIAVWPQFTGTYVLVTDQLLSSDVASVDGAMKMAMIAPVGQWTAMFAGDATRFPPLMDRARELLGDVRNTRLSLESIASVVEKAYEIELRKRVEVDILMPYGMNRDEFVARGREAVGDVRFNLVMDQIAATDLGIELLVVGLDGHAQSQMFTVTAKGAIVPSVLRYEAIGNGAPTALGTFYQLKYFPTPDLEDVVYRACAAKFAAENVPGVGRQTYALLVEPMSGVWTVVMEVERLREIWESKGQPPVPSEARRLVARDLRRLMKTEEYSLKRDTPRREVKTPKKPKVRNL
jgi:hypothetical protein